jgi:hypothetical protein
MPWKKGNRLKLVPESQARGRTLEIFEELKQALGIPEVTVVFQAYASYPTFLDLHWRALRPVVKTQQFFGLAERLRADSYTRIHSYFDIPDLCARVEEMKFSPGARDELTGVVDLWHYCEPAFLLIVAAQFQAFESTIGHKAEAIIPASHPVFTQRPIAIDEETAPPATHAIYEDMRRTLHLPAVPVAYRNFARWPDFLQVYWKELKGLLQSPVYEGCHYGARETAFALTREFPEPVDLTVTQLSEAGLTDDDIASVVRITELFVNGLSALVLNISYAKISLEGGTHRAIPQKEIHPASTGKTEHAA